LARPQITLKLATSLDGKIALKNGMSEWITGSKSREYGRKLRSKYDAILIGSNTAVLDNPQLTTRIDGENDPIRIVFDTNLRISEKSNLVLTAKKVPVWIFSNVISGNKFEELSDHGVRIIRNSSSSNINLTSAMQLLSEKGVKSLLLEGGGVLASSFLRIDAVDVIEWFRAPLILGGDSRDSISDLGLISMDFVKRFNRIQINELGEDTHETYERII
jgi:diaminohydroxyphosphoribosylaminopyrimidine deaminase/5-amino-6-(5-phosphoribosylamino)uracil reductase